MDEQAAYEERLRRRLKLLRKYLEEGKLKLPDSEIIDDLAKIRADEHGEPILDTVSGRVRALALAVEGMERQQELESVSLSYVQTEYFAFLEDLLGDLVRLTDKAPPWAVAEFCASKQDMVKGFYKEAPKIRESLHEFWSTFGDVVRVHLIKGRGVKAVFGGDVFPSPDVNAICHCGLYADTIVLPDPLHRTIGLMEGMGEAQLLEQTVKHGLAALKIRDLAFADLDYPVVVVCPGSMLIDEHQRDYLFTCAEADALVHLNTTCRIQAESILDAIDQLQSIGDASDIERRAHMPGRLVFDDEWNLPLANRVSLAREHQVKYFPELGGDMSDAEVICRSALGRMAQANETVMRSVEYQGEPLVDAPTSWQYLLWKYEYDASRTVDVSRNTLDSEIVNALVHHRQKVGEYLANITPEALLRLRQAGVLAGFRAKLREGIEATRVGDAAGKGEVAGDLLKTLGDMLEEHTRQVAEHKEKGKEFFGVDVRNFALTATVAMVGPISGNYALSVLSAAGGLLGLPSAKDLWKKGKALIDEGTELRRSPMGILVHRR